MALRGGFISEIEVEIPWTKLKTDSVVVRLHQPMLLFAPHSEGEWDMATERRRSAARKARELQQLREAAAPLSTGAASAPIDDSTGSGFLDKLVAKVVDNVQVLVTNAIVRYEDYSHGDAAFGFEFAFDSLWVHPEHIFAEGGSGSGGGGGGDERPPLAHREALVCALCAYMLDSSQLPAQPQRQSCASAEALQTRLRSSGIPLDAPAALRTNARRCCIAPLSFAAELASRRVDQPSLPQHVCCLETGRVQVELSSTELERLTAAAAYFQHFDAFEASRRFRPPIAQRPATHAAAWWRFAISAVRWQLQAAREPYTWPAVKRRGQQRRAFVNLHKKRLQRGGALHKLSEPERVSLAQLCDALSAADQLLFERLAEAQLKGDRLHTAPLAAAAAAAAMASPHRKGGGTATATGMRLSSEQRAALADLLGSDSDPPPLRERLSFHARLLLSEAHITLHMPSQPSNITQATLRPGAHAAPSPPSTPTPSRLPRTPSQSLPWSPVTPGGTPCGRQLQIAIHNLGVHAGLEPRDTCADVFWQSVRVAAVSQGEALPAPLVNVIPQAAQRERRRSSAAARIGLEVDTTKAFADAGLADRLPALCTRSDSAHQASQWQLGVRWHADNRQATAGLLDEDEDGTPEARAHTPSSRRATQPAPSHRSSAGATDERQSRSEMSIRWRSSQQLAILANHAASAEAAQLLSSIGQAMTSVDPTSQLRASPAQPAAARDAAAGAFGETDEEGARSSAEDEWASARLSGASARLSGGSARLSGASARLSGASARLSGGSARLSGGSARLSGGSLLGHDAACTVTAAMAASMAKMRAAGEATIHQSVRSLYGMVLRISIDLATPTWLWLLEPAVPTSRAIILSARRLLADGLIEPAAGGRDGGRELPSRLRGFSGERTPRSPQTPQTPTLGRTNSGGGPLKDRAKRASWGIVRNVSFLSRRPKKSSDGGDDGGTSPQSRADSLLRRPSLDMALGGSSSPSRRSSSAGGHGEPCGPPGGRLRLEAEHVHVSIATLVDWGLSTPLDEREVPQHTQHADAPLAPFDVALALRAPTLERGAVDLGVTFTPFSSSLRPKDISALGSLIQTFQKPPPPDTASAASAPTATPAPLTVPPSMPPMTPMPSGPPLHPMHAIVLAVLLRSRLRIDLASITFALHEDSEHGADATKASGPRTSMSAAPLLQMRLVCIALVASGWERISEDARAASIPSDAAAWAQARQQMLQARTEASATPNSARGVARKAARGGIQLALSVAAVHLSTEAASNPTDSRTARPPLQIVMQPALVPDADAHESDEPSSSDDEASPPMPSPDCVIVHLNLAPDPLTGFPGLSPSHPPLIELGEILATIQPSACIKQAARLYSAAEDARLISPGPNHQGVHNSCRADTGSVPSTPSTPPAPPAPFSPLATIWSLQGRAIGPHTGASSPARALLTTSVMVNCASLEIIDDTPYPSSSASPRPEHTTPPNQPRKQRVASTSSRARVKLSVWKVSLGFPANNVKARVGAVQLALGPADETTPPTPLLPLISTRGVLKALFSPGEAWVCELSLPVVDLHEPLTPSDALHSLLAAITKLSAAVAPTQASEITVTTPARPRRRGTPRSKTPTPLASQVAEEVPLDESLPPELDVRLILQPSYLIDHGPGASSNGVGESGLALRVGAIKLLLGLRPSPEWRGQLSTQHSQAAGEGGTGFETWLHSSQKSLALLAAQLPECSTNEGSVEASQLGEGRRVAWLPDAALHCTLELRPDWGPQPVEVQLAFGPQPARLQIEPHSWERMNKFAERLAALQPPEQGELPARVAVSLPGLQVEMVAETTLPAPIFARADGISLLLAAQPNQIAADAPEFFVGPVNVRARVQKLSVGLAHAGAARSTSELSVPLLLSPIVSAVGSAYDEVPEAPPRLRPPVGGLLEARFYQPANWKLSASLEMDVSPVRVVISPEMVEAAAAHTAGWMHLGASGADRTHSDRPDPETTMASVPPLNLSLKLEPSEVWLVLRPVSDTPSSSTVAAVIPGVHGVAEECASCTVQYTTASTPSSSSAGVEKTRAVEPRKQYEGLQAGDRLGARTRLGISATIHNAPQLDSHSMYGVRRTPPGKPWVGRGKSSTFECILDHYGSCLAPLPSSGINDDSTWTSVGDGGFVLDPLQVRSRGKLTNDNEHVMSTQAVDASIELSGAVCAAISAPQVKILLDLAAQLSMQEPDRSKRKAKREGKKAQSREAKAAMPTEHNLESEDAHDPSFLSSWLESQRLSSFKCKLVATSGVNLTLYGIGGAPEHPMVRVCIPSVIADTQARGGSAAHHAAQLGFGVEVLLWARSSQAWEPLLARTSVSAQVQQVRGGIWSGCLELDSIDLSASDAMVQRLIEASTAINLSLKAPTSLEALRPKSRPPAVHITNQTGCAIIVQLRGDAVPHTISPGEKRVLALLAHESHTSSAECGSTGIASVTSADIDELIIDANGIPHAIPPLPSGRFGSWTLLAKPKASPGTLQAATPPVSSTREQTSSASAHVPTNTIGEPVAVQCTVRPLAEGAGAGVGRNLSLVMRSIASVQNTTSTALAVQLLMPAAGGTEGGGMEVLPAAHMLSRAIATPSAVDLGFEQLLDLGILPAGGAMPIPPQLANVAHLRARPVHGNYSWPEASESFWLGSCNHTRQQARQLTRIQALFALPSTEQLHASYAALTPALPLHQARAHPP